MSKIIKELPLENSVVITKNGRPCAVFLPVTEETDLESMPPPSEKIFGNCWTARTLLSPPDQVNVIVRFDLIQETMLLKTLRSSFENLRTNGGGAEMVGEFPFMLSLVEAFLGFFSRIRNKA